MKKSFLSFLLLGSLSVLSADWLLNTTYVCVKSYYFTPSTGTLYYTRSDTGATASLTTKSLADDLIDGYEYNATSNRCQKIAINNTLGMDNLDFNYLNAIIGLALALLMLWSIYP